ncbi:MAG: SIMPL domain-containing protein [Chloroflexi bacterium]|nr:SIMPL domain-containing protein [Chloroflexota bacterium]
MSTTLARFTLARLRRIPLLIVALAVFAAFLASSAPSAPSFTPRPAAGADTSAAPEHTISVSGTGTVTLSPDVADLHLGVVVTRSTVRAARADAATAMTAVIAALKSAGIADADIQTSLLSLQPQYDYSNGGSVPRLTGYQFANSVTATVRHLDALGGAIDGAIAAGATTLDSVVFRVNDPTRAEAQARTAAMADARAKADALAAAAGVTISGVSSIAETTAPTPIPIPYLGAAAPDSVKSVPTPVQAGTNQVTVSVAVVYRIP